MTNVQKSSKINHGKKALSLWYILQSLRQSKPIDSYRIKVSANGSAVTLYGAITSIAPVASARMNGIARITPLEAVHSVMPYDHSYADVTESASCHWLSVLYRALPKLFDQPDSVASVHYRSVRASVFSCVPWMCACCRCAQYRAHILILCLHYVQVSALCACFVCNR